MNRFFYFLLVLTASIFCLSWNLPWFSIGLIALVAALPFRLRRRSGFWFAYLSGLFVWGAYLTYVQFSNDGIMANRIGELFGLGSGWTIAAISALWGGITAGLGGWTGVCLRKAIKHEAASIGE